MHPLRHLEQRQTVAGDQVIEIPVRGMDCASCAGPVRQAIAALPGVQSVDVRVSAEKAVVRLDPATADPAAIRAAIEAAGFTVPLPEPGVPATAPARATDFTRQVLALFGLVFGAVLLVVVLGEWLGLLNAITSRVPWPLGAAFVLVAGYPVFRNVLRASLRGQVISHTLMSVGAFAALAVGQWATAVIVVFFMRVGDYAERFTSERGRRAVKDLLAMAPRTARVEREGIEQEIPAGDVRLGEIVIVRPGEMIPVDGEITSGQATIDQAAITGESMPVEVSAGDQVFAATLAQFGSLHIRTSQVGPETTFGRVVRMVEEAETHRGTVQRLADRFSAYFLPVVALIAVLTFLIRRDPLATAAVLVVACSCSFALATPIAMLATIGASAKRGLLIKGGKYVETLARADVLLLDKTGTLTTGAPRITDVVPFNGRTVDDVLGLAATAERDSEHPLAEAVRIAARERAAPELQPEAFEAIPGFGVRARINGRTVTAGSARLVASGARLDIVRSFEAEGKTTLLIAEDGDPIGVLAAADTVRPEVLPALDALRRLGIGRIELLTGDNERVAAALAGQLGIAYRANLLPEEKIAAVRDYQARGHTVVMVGDGVNDAPALAQADAGIAMGVAGTDIAIEAAHVVLMREDWRLVPELFQTARRTMRVVKLNIGFTAVYNVAGLSLAAFGFLPPILAAAAQSLPDLGMLANSARLLSSGNDRSQGSGTTAPIVSGPTCCQNCRDE